MGETPFALTNGSEAVIPVEVGMSTYQVQHFNPSSNDARLKEQLYLLAERRQEAKMQTMNNKRKFKRYFNKSVRPRFFKVGNLYQSRLES